jgi:type I restriction enzyme S subunit
MSIGIQKGWIVGTLGDLGKWTSGGTPSSKVQKYYNGPIPWVVTGDLADGPLQRIPNSITEEGLQNSSARLFPKGTLLVAMYGATIGRLGILTVEAATNQACAALIPSLENHEILPYVFYFLFSYREKLKKLGQGGAQPNISQTLLKEVQIPVAPLNEQKRIVDKIERLFSNLDEGEALLKQVQKQLATYRQSVLKAAVTGELTKDWREANKDHLESGEALLQRILKSRRENWKGRGKYQEPVIRYSPDTYHGWIWGVLETFCDIKGGVTVDAKKQIADPVEIPYLRVANVQDGYIDLNHVKSIKVDKSKVEELVLRDGDVLFTEGGDIDKLGRGWVWEGQLPICTHQNHIFRGRPFSAGIHPRFISYYCGSLGKEYFLNGGKQTTNLASISLTKLKAFPILLPSEAEQIEIVSKVDDINSQIDTLESWCATELARSATLRQSILKDAFSGTLVPQDPTDEPASELLKHIQAQKASMNKPRATKKRTKATT